MKTRNLILFGIFMLFSFGIKAQHIHECKAHLQQEVFFEANPEARKHYKKAQENRKKFIKRLKTTPRLKSQAKSEKYIIPVVFHVFGKKQSGKTVDQALIRDALAKTNKDFAGESPGQDDIHPLFENVVDFVNIEFRLAKLNPQGNPTSGINFYPEESGFGNGTGYDHLIKQYAWDNYKYMNIYIMNDLYDDGDNYNSGVSWYPNKWMSDNNLARTVYNGAYLGDNTNENFRRTLTHEFGHFFDLMHTFEGGCPEQNGGDKCDDTPETGKAHMEPDEENCHGELTNTQNFMNYTDDYQMYTSDQVFRILAALNDETRFTLWQEKNLETTGVSNGFELGNAILCPTTTIKENNPNNGKIDDYFNIKLNGNFEFTSGSLSKGNHYTITNLPEGLDCSLIKSDSKNAKLHISGKTENHNKMHSVDNLTISFKDEAFTVELEQIKNPIIDGLKIEFEDDANYELCDVVPEWGTGYGHIEKIEIGDFVYNTPKDLPGHIDLIHEHIIPVDKSGEITWKVIVNSGASSEKDDIGFKLFLDKNKNGTIEDSEQIFKDFFFVKNQEHAVFEGKIKVDDDSQIEEVLALRFMAYYRGADGNEKFDPGACDTLDSGNAVDIGLKFPVGTGMKTINSKSELINIHPNPTSSQLYINSLDKINRIIIYNLAGNKLMETMENSKETQLNLSDLTNGLYFIQIQTNDYKIIKKVNKKD
ncbi:MAG: zinc-dependent metalloprotease [Bacteroidota bacterium]